MSGARRSRNPLDMEQVLPSYRQCTASRQLLGRLQQGLVPDRVVHIQQYDYPSITP